MVAGYGTNYASFFLPGILTMTCFSIAFNTSWRFFTERENGIFLELLTYPITRQELVIGKILFNVLLAIAGCFLAIGAGVPMMDIQVRWENTLGIIAGIVLGTGAWFFFLTVLAMRVRRIDAFNAITSFRRLFIHSQSVAHYARI
jgi:ABC-type Na+ efflux pump permease subunit